MWWVFAIPGLTAGAITYRPSGPASLTSPHANQRIFLFPAPQHQHRFAGQVGGRELYVHIVSRPVVDVGAPLFDCPAGIPLALGQARFNERIDQRQAVA